MVFKYMSDKCPYCGGDNLDYENTETDYYAGEVITTMDIYCNDCRKFSKYVESYEISGVTVYDEDGREIYDSDKDKVLKSRSPKRTVRAKPKLKRKVR